ASLPLLSGRNTSSITPSSISACRPWGVFTEYRECGGRSRAGLGGGAILASSGHCGHPRLTGPTTFRWRGGGWACAVALPGDGGCEYITVLLYMWHGHSPTHTRDRAAASAEPAGRRSGTALCRRWPGLPAALHADRQGTAGAGPGVDPADRRP